MEKVYMRIPKSGGFNYLTKKSFKPGEMNHIDPNKPFRENAFVSWDIPSDCMELDYHYKSEIFEVEIYGEIIKDSLGKYLSREMKLGEKVDFKNLLKDKRFQKKLEGSSHFSVFLISNPELAKEKHFTNIQDSSLFCTEMMDYSPKLFKDYLKLNCKSLSSYMLTELLSWDKSYDLVIPLDSIEEKQDRIRLMLNRKDLIPRLRKVMDFPGLNEQEIIRILGKYPEMVEEFDPK